MVQLINIEAVHSCVFPDVGVFDLYIMLGRCYVVLRIQQVSLIELFLANIFSIY